MTKLAPLFKLESFRATISGILGLRDAEFDALVVRAIGDYESISGDVSYARSEGDLTTRAIVLLYDTAVREGVDNLLQELRAAMPDEDAAAVSRLERAITPGPTDRERVQGLSLRDAFLPILEGHKFAIDFRLVNSPPQPPQVVPFISARLIFDDVVGNGGSSLVFQINPRDLRGLGEALSDLADQLSAVVESGHPMTFPAWGHGLGLE